MVTEADDYLQTCETLDSVVAPLEPAMLDTPTLFKGWTFSQIIGHLYMFDRAASIALNAPDDAQKWFRTMARGMGGGASLMDLQKEWLGDFRGEALLDAWRESYAETARQYRSADPKVRIPWVGPSMSARSSITARQMETWAHGQAIFDALGLERRDTDAIKNIAHLGVRTFEWTFRNRGRTPPSAPFVELSAPSGAVWSWNDRSAREIVAGSATEFCQVVTQTRNVTDTNLSVRGEAANQWMAMAQCFAGPPQDPPAPGVRKRAGGP